MPPKLHFSQLGGWNEVLLLRSWKESTRILRDLNQRLYLEKGVASFFNEVDTVKELSSRPLFHFLMSLTQDKELCLHPLFHFLTRLTQDQELYSWPLFHFLTSLTQDKELCSHICSWTIHEHGSQEVFTRWKNHASGGIHVSWYQRQIGFQCPST